MRVTDSLDSVAAPGFCVRVIEYAARMWQPVHTHDQASVTLVLTGAIEEERKIQTDYAAPFSVIVKAPRIPHSNRFGPNGCKTLQITLPLGFDIRECGIEAQPVIWHNNGGTSIGALLRLLKCTTQASLFSESHVSLCLYEALEALPNKVQNRGVARSWLVRTKDLIDSSDPLHPFSMAQLQKCAGVHPVYLTRQFKRHFGCAVREYMQFRRIRAAASLMAESSLTLTEVAHRCEFADQAHFCRAFRNVAHLTARDYRRLTKTVRARKVANVQY